MAETQHGRLVRCRRTSQIHPRKPPQRRRFIERVFHTRVRQVEPLLKKVNPQHDRQTYGLAAITCPGIMRLDQRFQFPPRNDSFHRLQKLFPLTLPPVLLEAALGRQCNLSHRAPYPLTTLPNSAVDLGLVQRFLRGTNPIILTVDECRIAYARSEPNLVLCVVAEMRDQLHCAVADGLNSYRDATSIME